MPNAGASLRIRQQAHNRPGHRAAERGTGAKNPIAGRPLREIQLLMILFPAALTGPSAIPKERAR